MTPNEKANYRCEITPESVARLMKEVDAVRTVPGRKVSDS